MSSVAIVVYTLGLLFFGWHRILAYLRYFQQEEYSATRFWAWIREKRAFDRRGLCVATITTLLTYFTTTPTALLLVAALGSLAFVGIARFIEEDPRTSGKIRLTMTQRATKIAQVSFIVFFGLSFVWMLCACPTCHAASQSYDPFQTVAQLSIILVMLPPALLMVANLLLSPAERSLQQSFLNDAKRILAEVDPFVIGITGSYGKTGAKAALGELLTQCLGPTFWPKKSINTVMGITRTIRETMRPYHKYAVIEMGAYNIGSIKRLCDFTPPRASLVTAVGIMHLERFGSPENVYRAKSEIAQALPEDGILVCNGDSPNARRMASEHARQTTLLYGLDRSAGHLDCFASDISFDDKGTRFVIHWRGSQYPGRTPLLGRPALSNALGAFTMACALGADPAYAVACMANLEPVDNRLVLDRKPAVSFLRDAYNSNPTGFAAALEVLKTLPATQRVVMTPGMIELGDQQFSENRRLASEAAHVANLIIVVGSANREAILAGLGDAGFSKDATILVDSRDEAFSVIQSRCGAGSLVLIENDLGDLHEGRVRF